MEDFQLKYIQIGINYHGNEYCCGDSVSYSFVIRRINILDYSKQIKQIFYFLKSKFQLSENLIKEAYHFDVKNMNEFKDYDFNVEFNGSIICESDIQLIWFNSQNRELKEINLPLGCRLIINKNDKLDDSVSIFLHFNFNLFSNNLLSIARYGKSEKELYYFKPAARINRALVRSAVLELKLKHPEVEIEFNNEIGWLSNFDKYGFTEETDYVFD